MKSFRNAGLMSFALLAGSAEAAPETLKFYGYAYDLKSGQYLYTEVYNEQVKDGRWLSGTTKYYSADGKSIGEKKADFSIDPYIPVYQLDQPRVGYSEGITAIDAKGVSMYKESREKGRQTATVERTDPMAADAGFHSFIVAHMDALMADKVVKFKFAVAGQLDEYSFRVRKIGDTVFEGKPAVKLQVEPDSMLRFAVDPLVLSYDPVEKRLLEYRGVSNVINPATGKAYTVRIEYYSKPPDDAPKNLPPLD